MSETGSASAGSRFVEVDWNATQCGRDVSDPSSDGFVELPFPCTQRLLTLASRSLPVRRLRRKPRRPRGRRQTKTSVLRFVSWRTRFDAAEWDAASRVLRLSPDTAGPPESPLGGRCAVRTEIGNGRVPKTFGCSGVPYHLPRAATGSRRTASIVAARS